MNSLNDAKETILKNKPILENKYKVKKIGFFGSMVRGEGTESSDIDILVELREPIGWDFIELKDYLEEILGREVDLVTIKALKPQLREIILNEVVFT